MDNRVLVIGAGTFYEKIVRTFLSNGVSVAAVSRDDLQSEILESYVQDLVTERNLKLIIANPFGGHRDKAAFRALPKKLVETNVIGVCYCGDINEDDSFGIAMDSLGKIRPKLKFNAEPRLFTVTGKEQPVFAGGKYLKFKPAWNIAAGQLEPDYVAKVALEKLTRVIAH